LSVSVEDLVTKAVDIMVTNDTGSVVVYDGDQFVGMVTFREVLNTLHEKGYESGSCTLCGDIIDKEHSSCATPDDSVEQLRSLMIDNHIRYLPVVQDGSLTDIVSFYDVARSLAKQINYENRLLKEYIRNWPEQENDNE
jgi:CBS domain-containing protein